MGIGRVLNALRMEIKAQVLQRDNHECRACHSKINLTIHHLKRQANHPELKYDINNLITLCRPCHDAWHAINPPKSCPLPQNKEEEKDEWMAWARKKGGYPPAKKRKEPVN